MLSDEAYCNERALFLAQVRLEEAAATMRPTTHLDHVFLRVELVEDRGRIRDHETFEAGEERVGILASVTFSVAKQNVADARDDP